MAEHEITIKYKNVSLEISFHNDSKKITPDNLNIKCWYSGDENFAEYLKDSTYEFIECGPHDLRNTDLCGDVLGIILKYISPIDLFAWLKEPEPIREFFAYPDDISVTYYGRICYDGKNMRAFAKLSLRHEKIRIIRHIDFQRYIQKGTLVLNESEAKITLIGTGFGVAEPKMHINIDDKIKLNISQHSAKLLFP